jgi:hypothetical protein
MRRHILLGGQLGRQLRRRDVRLGLDPVEQSRQMRRQLAAARRTALTRRLGRAGAQDPIDQLYREACTDIERAGRRPTRLPLSTFRWKRSRRSIE